MSGLPLLGKTLMLAGVALLLVGALLAFAGRIPGLGRLPGDFAYRRGNFTFYFPLATSILLSLLLTLVLAWLGKR